VIERLDQWDPRFPTLNEPFARGGRQAARLVFDFGAMLSCFCPDFPNRRVLDFCAGTGWISEWLNRLGYQVTAIDINADGANCLRLRAELDGRVDPANIEFQHADGHALPFEDGRFGHVCSFDSLHHMHDYRKSLSELARVLAAGGRAVFVEPGARHSRSPETLAFIEQYKKDDPTWIERDVVLEEIAAIAHASGFADLYIRPMLLPTMIEYPLSSWQQFRQGHEQLQQQYLEVFTRFSYDDHLVFFLQKPAV
jgi:ubiquinone/menaquinone biosynthesis C-methylase UbiE